MSREQKLIDLCFSLVGTALDKKYRDSFDKMTYEEQMKWVADRLKGCGFETTPVGVSWGVLNEHFKSGNPSSKGLN